MTGTPTFTANGVVKRFGRKPVLAGLDLELEAGCVTVLLGENGAGKSTLLKLALGVLAPDSGTVRVAGLDPLRDTRRVRELAGYVPDRPDVYGWMTVRDFFRFLAPQYPTWDAARADELVATLRIPERTRFKSLSRGEGMKAMLAAALAPRPRLLLLDEPFGGLDPLVREEVLRSVIGELRDGGTTLLVATHDLDVVARLADRVAILAQGRITAHGTLAQVVGARAADGQIVAAEGEIGDAPARLRDALANARETASCAS